MSLLCTQTFPAIILQIPLRSVLRIRKGKSDVQRKGKPGFLPEASPYPYREYWSAGAARTKYHRQCDLNNRNPFSHSVGGWKSQIQMLAVLVSLEASLPGLQVAGLWRRPHTGFSLCVRPGASLFLLVLLD